MTGGVPYNAEAVHENFRDLTELRAFARWLIEQWDRVRVRPFEMKPEFARGGGQMIWSYTNHVVELMRTVLALSEQNRLVIALPLIRLMVENAVTSIWLYLEPENVRAVIHEGLRLRKAALENVLETAAEGYDQSDVDEVAEEMEEFAQHDLPAGRSFEQRCRSIAGGMDVYMSWRVLSSLSHAGMAMGDFYLEEIDQAPGIAFAPDVEAPNHEPWLGTAICMVIAALKTCNEIDGKGRLRAQVARAEKRMGISMTLQKAK